MYAKIRSWFTALAHAQSPAWLTLLAVLMGIGCIAMTVTAAFYAIRVSEPFMALLFAGLTVYCVWATWALCDASISPELGLGTRVTLIAFLVGSLLTLFESPADVFRGDLADSTGWQTFFWFVGVALATWGLEKERRTKKRISPREIKHVEDVLLPKP